MLFKVLIVFVNACAVFALPRLQYNIEPPFKFYSRSDWQALPSIGTTLLQTPVPYIVIHHTYIPSACDNHEKCSAAMQSMQNYHMRDLKWGDIGYNFCIGSTGDVYEGRGWETKGIHAGPANSVSVGICLIGDWRVQQPPQEMLESAKALIQLGVTKGYIKPDYKLVGHNQVMATECPGKALSNIISNWEHFSESFSN